MASARTKKPWIQRALVSSRSRPVFALNIALTLKALLPDSPMSQALRSITPWAMSPTAGINEGSEKPASSPMMIGGK